MARKFLYIILGITVLVIAIAFALRIWSEDLTELALVPDSQFKAQPPLAANVYEEPEMWFSRPGLGAADAARWVPQGAPKDDSPLDAAVFFVHPTSYIEKEQWNGPLDDQKSQDIARLFVKAMASPFNKSLELWAPRYRQAAFGAFLTDDPQATQALDLAYGDVAQAFDYFLATAPKDKPIVLAGHSQGAFLLRRLLKERVAGQPLAKRIAAAYIVGWPVSPEHDLPAMGLPACATADQPGCVVSWLSFAEPAETDMIAKAYARRLALDGQPIGESPFLCTNPLTGTPNAAAEAKANLGTLVPDKESLKSGEMKTATLTQGAVPARCGPDGFLYIGAPPELGPYVLPGNNYHVYDIPLFWANLRTDVARRVKAWKP